MSCCTGSSAGTVLHKATHFYTGHSLLCMLRERGWQPVKQDGSACNASVLHNGIGTARQRLCELDWHVLCNAQGACLLCCLWAAQLRNYVPT